MHAAIRNIYFSADCEFHNRAILDEMWSYSVQTFVCRSVLVIETCTLDDCMWSYAIFFGRGEHVIETCVFLNILTMQVHCQFCHYVVSSTLYWIQVIINILIWKLSETLDLLKSKFSRLWWVLVSTTGLKYSVLLLLRQKRGQKWDKVTLKTNQ